MVGSDRKAVEIPAKSVPVIIEADVVVIGGGSSGFIAAVAAARTGAKTALVERFGYLGGCSTAPYNTSLGRFGDSDGNRIIGGIPWEFLERMKADGRLLMVDDHNPELWPPWTKKVALDMVEEAGVDLTFYTWVSGVLKEGNAVSGLITHSKGGDGVVVGKTYVDATGDADIAAFAGAPFEMTDVEHLQQVSCDYIACGVDAKRVVEWARQNRDKIRKVGGLDVDHKGFGAEHMLKFVIPQDDTRDGYHVGVMPTVKLCIYREAVRCQGNVEIDPLDPKALTMAETKGLRGAIEHLEYMKRNVPGFEGAFLASQSHLGVRETRRIVGGVVLTVEDIKNHARFDDVIALNCRSLDYHLAGTVFQIEHVEGNHDIPLRALMPKGLENVIVCGRSVSCDHPAQASLRGAAPCMATGHAAGTAAVLAARADGSLREVDIRAIQRTLLDQDAVLGTGDREAEIQRAVEVIPEQL